MAQMISMIWMMRTRFSQTSTIWMKWQRMKMALIYLTPTLSAITENVKTISMAVQTLMTRATMRSSTLPQDDNLKLIWTKGIMNSLVSVVCQQLSCKMMKMMMLDLTLQTNQDVDAITTMRSKRTRI